MVKSLTRQKIRVIQKIYTVNSRYFQKNPFLCSILRGVGCDLARREGHIV